MGAKPEMPRASNIGILCPGCQVIPPTKEWIYFPTAFALGSFLHWKCGHVEIVVSEENNA